MCGPKDEHKKGARIPAAADLSAWANHGWTEGVQIDHMEDLETLVVQTYSSTYEITVLCGRTGEILVRGGPFFRERTAAQLSGASLGGSFLKMRGVYVGLCMELHIDDARVITSPVRSINWPEHKYVEAA